MDGIVTSFKRLFIAYSHVWAAVLVHIIVIIAIVLLLLLHFLVQFGQLLFSLDVLVEVEAVPSQVHHHLNLTNQDLVELLDVGLDVGAGLVHVLEDGHLLLDDLDTLLTAGVVLEYELLLLLQDLLNYFLVVLAELLDVLGVLGGDLLEGGHAVTEPLPLRSLVALILLLPVLPALEELAADAFLELWLEPLLAKRWSLARTSGLRAAWLLRRGPRVAVGFGQEVAGVVSTARLDHRPEECLLVTLSECVSCVRCWPLRLRALEALFEAVDLVLQTLQRGSLASSLWSIA